MKLIDFNTVSKNLRRYAGDAGNKFGVRWNDENWIIKFPKSTRSFVNPRISYTTSPLSEYLGSKIYESMGLPVHDTVLGFRKSEFSERNKLVVACRDFRKTEEQLIEFKEIKNSQFFSDGSEGTGGAGALLSEVLETIEQNSLFDGLRQETRNRFWDMFVIDFVIGNNDRNNTNWGLIADEEQVLGLAPVYDNGNSFFNKRSESQFEQRLDNPIDLEADIKSTLSFYTTDDGHHIKPSELISEQAFSECNQAVKRFMARFDFEKIKQLIEEIPAYANELSIMPQSQKDYTLLIIENKVKKILQPTYEAILNQEKELKQVFD